MSAPPARPRIYHITHVENLPTILAEDGLWSDSAMATRNGPLAPIGMDTIKERRRGLPVKCHPGDHVGDYVPFYFCPRSIMLYLIYRANHPGLTYQGGQSLILHLEADLRETVAWAQSQGRRWAFSLSNAGARYTAFRNRLDHLDEVDWEAVTASNFSTPKIKEGKQAEFLLHTSFPWHLVQRIGVQSPAIQSRVAEALAAARHLPAVEVRYDWYF